MSYRLAIFDFDGTLADSFPFMMSCLDQLADQYRVRRMDPNQLDFLRRLDPLTLMKMHNVPVWKLPFMARSMQMLMANRVKNIPVFEGVHESLRELKARGVTLAMLSSNHENNIRSVLGEYTAGLFRYYETRVGLFGKARRLQKLLRRSGLSPNETICIGDEVRDADAARRAGVAFGAVSWGYAHPDALSARSPQLVFESVAQLVEKIAP